MLTTMLALLGLAAASAGPPASEAERLVQAQLPEFELRARQGGGPISAEEWVPRGETVERWTRMVTTMRFGGATANVAPAQFVRMLAEAAAGSCPGMEAGELRSFQLVGRSAAEMRLDCPRLPDTGLPETFFVRAIAGRTDLYMVQVAFRRIPTAEDVAFAETHLRSVALCGATRAEAPCD
jgi:hypothetical protein